MKQLLYSAALIAFAAPAYAQYISTTTSGLGPDFTKGGDEAMMFLDNAKDTNTFTGSTTGNGSHFSDSIVIDTMGFVDTSSGFATIKPIKDGTLTDLVYTPQSQFTYDGFFTRGQLEYDAPTCLGAACAAPAAPPTTATVHIDVTADNGKVTQFTFDEPTPWTNDFAFIGFDEDPLKESQAALIKSVHMYIDASTDPNISFFEVKQAGWSLCNSTVDVTSGCSLVINPTGGVPEPSTWAMGIMGFAALGFMGFRRRNAAASA